MSEGFELGRAKPVVEREDSGQVVHIKDVTGRAMYHGDGEPVTVTVAGTYSQRYRRANDDQLRQMRSRRAMPDIEDTRKDAIALHAQCVLNWSGFFDSGKPLECTPANVARVLTAAPWIHEQVVVAMEDHAGFFEGDSPN